MQEVIGTNNRMLEIDLTAKKFQVTEVDKKDRDLYLGGKGLGLKLLYDRMEPGLDPLGPDNMIAFTMGILMGTGAPCSGRFEAITKSPLTGAMVTGTCGGPFGMAVKTSGWDAIIVKGKCSAPTYLYIDSKGVQFKPAKGIWGKDTEAAQAALLKEGAGAIVIGPAGENLVKYANIASGHRFLGRGGIGAVMGSKNLKGIVARGNEFKIVPANKKKFAKANKRFFKFINKNPITSGSYRSFGTNANVNLSNASGILPVRNFTGGSHGEAHKISGETMAERFHTKYDTCKPCAILCGHRGTINGKEHHIPEYETIGLMGSNLEIFDPAQIVEWNELCSKYGMDTISTGGTLAWAMEATEKGLIKTNLKFGSPSGVSEMIRDIAYRKGMGNDLAEGSRAASKKYGGEDFAIHVKGLEMAAYDPRGCVGHGLSYATANRGACHLSSVLFSLEAYLGMASPYATRWKPFMVKFMENVLSAVNSLHICLFTAYAVFLEPPLIKLTPVPLIKQLNQNLSLVALNLMDVSLWPELWHAVLGKTYIPYLGMLKFIKAGERVHVLERYMNTREGISRKDDTLPRRFLTEGRKCDQKEHTVPLEKMLGKYYRLRGYDANGIPKKRTLKRLNIAIQ
ncbi:MAG TPA: aldehyde ferredoxin oxidoreductase family protein [Spirochaetota bacterium]|nr:aldehyde ferredoxin oxidoreductase family protein [Spirochaetota bacterium]HPC42019.1 aldehyde ferredoxin oxidoreductase family protein [Spirochaetota bacterium]HPL17623.1 aldehyde ferredoxin oxidoreductase family protein [Spirochaetota bacterium]HQF09536.1 aldehyde ferredoxin oxidoreductase family protein [Spirochaetota bacterium]HQH98394.1 aldehyde ferredoxin oxidoreductase family protein [Spirochaetota bacterium]